VNVYEQFALGHYLCEIPKGKTFDEVLEMVIADDVYVWQPFERYEREELAEKIEDMRDALFGTFIPRKDIAL
jgi:hypothetical protein